MEFFQKIPEQLFVLFGAELFFIIANNQNLIILAKSDRQRTLFEKNKVSRGLLRRVIIEALLSVPASALMLLLITPVFGTTSFFTTIPSITMHSITGMVSYLFPFTTIRIIITHMAIRTLKESLAMSVKGAEAEITLGNELLKRSFYDK